MTIRCSRTQADPHAAKAKAKTSIDVTVSQHGNNTHNSVTFKSSANADARSNNRGLRAQATATASVKGSGSDENGAGTGGSKTTSSAAAISSRTNTSAMAMSSNGGYAIAITGPGGYTDAYVKDGIESTKHFRNTTIEIAYSIDGSFSLAETNGRVAHAMTGATDNVGALASGNLSMIFKTASFAEAYADQLTAWAFASAGGYGEAGTSSGFAAAGGGSSAFAMVTHTPPPVIVAVGSKTAECVNTDLEIKGKLKKPWQCHYIPAAQAQAKKGQLAFLTLMPVKHNHH